MAVNLLLACDQIYYSTWAINCINSIRFFNPDIIITTHIVNPKNHLIIKNVKYSYETITFSNKESEISYYQAVRFLQASKLFSTTDLVFSIDCDTVCSKQIPKKELENLTTNISILKHHKENRWMAGLVSYGNNDFRNKLAETLLSKPINDWKYGWDQQVLNQLSTEFSYNELVSNKWMSFGKGNGYFLTLKGDQKTTSKYLKNYNGVIDGIT